MKIAIVGLGGVGGYLGAHLAQKYTDSPENEIYFLVTENSYADLKINGLHLKSSTKNFSVHPKAYATMAIDLPTMDLIIFGVKSYALHEVLQDIQPMVSANTRFIPFLNGVNSESIIQKTYPENVVWNGFVFIYAQKKNSYTIEEFGDFHEYVWGTKDDSNTVEEFKAATHEVGCRIVFDASVRYRQWKKFFFISTLSSLCTYHNCLIGEVLENKIYRAQYAQLLTEFMEYAHHKMKIEGMQEVLTEEDKLMIWNQLEKSNPKGTTSMQRDYVQHPSKTELDMMTGDLARYLGEQSLYHVIYQQLK